MENSPLQRFPGELRNRIYELTMFVPDGVHISLVRPEPKAIRKVFCWPAWPMPVSGLPRTCNAIRAECLQTFFAVNEFEFNTAHFDRERSAGGWILSLSAWVRIVGEEQVMQIERVKISLGTWTCTSGLAKPRLQTQQMRIIRDMFHADTKIEMAFRADLHCPIEPLVNVLELSFPLGRPVEALLRTHEERRSIVRNIKATIACPLSRMASLEVFVMCHDVLEHMLSQMM